MKKSQEDHSQTIHKSDHTNGNDLPGYPIYASTDDIYNKNKEEDIDPEDISNPKEPKEKAIENIPPEKGSGIRNNVSELDVPGSELDDEQEDTGNEDEENNYYSLGGDDHENLDEDRGEG